MRREEFLKSAVTQTSNKLINKLAEVLKPQHPSLGFMRLEVFSIVTFFTGSSVSHVFLVRKKL